MYLINIYNVFVKPYVIYKPVSILTRCLTSWSFWARWHVFSGQPIPCWKSTSTWRTILTRRSSRRSRTKSGGANSWRFFCNIPLDLCELSVQSLGHFECGFCFCCQFWKHSAWPYICETFAPKIKKNRAESLVLIYMRCEAILTNQLQ